MTLLLASVNGPAEAEIAVAQGVDIVDLKDTSKGAFGAVTRERLEVVIKGTDAEFPDASAQWREYEFKGKPGDVNRRPCIISPYHWKLDWQAWFVGGG